MGWNVQRRLALYCSWGWQWTWYKTGCDTPEAIPGGEAQQEGAPPTKLWQQLTARTQIRNSASS
eukprot:745144-Prorocentrum_lima.AAC.1